MQDSAARLGSKEFARWIAWELDGYPADQPVPPYRRLNAQYYGNFMSVAWRADRQPFLWSALEEGAYEKLNPIEFRDGIAKAAALVQGASINRPELSFLVQGKMLPELDCMGVWVEIGGHEFQQLMSAVSSRVLDFVLEIEAANPNAGEAALNSHPVPEEKLQPLVQNFFGPVGSIAQHSHGFTQSANLEISAADLKKLVADLGTHLAELKLTPSDTKKVQAQLETVEAQLADTPNPVIVREAGKTIRSLTEGAISSLIANSATHRL